MAASGGSCHPSGASHPSDSGKGKRSPRRSRWAATAIRMSLCPSITMACLCSAAARVAFESVTGSVLSAKSLDGFGVERVPHAVAYKVEREHGGCDQQAGKPDQPGGVLQAGQSLLQHRAKTGVRGLNPQSKKAQRRFEDDRLSNT